MEEEEIPVLLTQDTVEKKIPVIPEAVYIIKVSLSFKLTSEPKAQVSFSYQNMPVVCCCCCCCCKILTFSSSSPELLGQFQPNLARSITD